VLISDLNPVLRAGETTNAPGTPPTSSGRSTTTWGNAYAASSWSDTGAICDPDEPSYGRKTGSTGTACTDCEAPSDIRRQR